MRIFFVGVHNKPDMQPLDSKSRSGKMIDRVISGLQTEVGLFEAEFIKTNLFNALQTYGTGKTDGAYYVGQWAKRVDYAQGDIVICCGAIVHSYFQKSAIKFIRIGHPSGVWSKLKQEEYIINACIKVSEEIYNKTVK
jgi:hypothetical protein